MDADDGVLGLDRVPAHKLAVPFAVLGLREAAMLGPEALEERLDGLGQPRVGGGLGGPAGVSAGGGHGEEGQDCDAGGLVLI